MINSLRAVPARSALKMPPVLKQEPHATEFVMWRAVRLKMNARVLLFKSLPRAGHLADFGRDVL